MAKARTVLGVDLSTRRLSTVLVGRGERVVSWAEVDETAADADARFAPLVTSFAHILLQTGPTEVYVEGLPFVKSRAGIVALASVLGAVRSACVFAEVPHAVVDGRDWKRGVGVRGTSKGAVRDWAIARDAPVNRWSQDLCDAYAIAVWGYRERSAR